MTPDNRPPRRDEPIWHEVYKWQALQNYGRSRENYDRFVSEPIRVIPKGKAFLVSGSFGGPRNRIHVVARCYSQISANKIAEQLRRNGHVED